MVIIRAIKARSAWQQLASDGTMDPRVLESLDDDGMSVFEAGSACEIRRIACAFAATQMPAASTVDFIAICASEFKGSVYSLRTAPDSHLCDYLSRRHREIFGINDAGGREPLARWFCSCASWSLCRLTRPRSERLVRHLIPHADPSLLVGRWVKYGVSDMA